MSTDGALLRQYVQTGDESAFAAFVGRHVDLVYAAALRRVGGRSDLAEEITQHVFSTVARKAPALVDHPVLAAWLHRSTGYAAIDALRAEARRQRLGQNFTAMCAALPSPEAAAEWEQLRPVIDDALDQLRPADRELVLLRYFKGLTFAEAGARLQLAEDAARRRTERALEKLRLQLEQRGVTSTAAALGVLMANQPLVAAPPTLAAAASAAALAGSGSTSAIVSFFLMSKITAPLLSAIIAAGLTAIVWTSTARNVSPDLAAARAENAKLRQAAAAGADSAANAAVADAYSANAVAIAGALAARTPRAVVAESAAPATATMAATANVTARGHRNRGTQTPHDAALTFAWACDICDPVELAKLVYIDPTDRARAEEIRASMPPAIQAQYATPEQLFGMLLAASCLEAPPPGADLMERMMTEVELGPDRAATRRTGSTRNVHEFQRTPDGWKYVLPLAGINGLPSILNSETLAKLSRH